MLQSGTELGQGLLSKAKGYSLKAYWSRKSPQQQSKQEVKTMVLWEMKCSVNNREKIIVNDDGS